MTENREQNTAVFGRVADPNIVTMSAVDKMKADLGVDLPVSMVPLPSLGKCYPPSHPLCGKEYVEIRAMTAREEDILMNQVLIKKGTVITELLKSCLVDRSIEPSTMLNGDRYALLVAIRISGYGQEYEVEYECSECDAKYKNCYDLSQLPLKMLELSPSKESSNYFEYVLPFTGKTVGFKFLTGVDEEEVAALKTSQKKHKLQSDSDLMNNMLRSIVTLDGNTDRSRIAQFVRLMPARDSLALRKYIRENEPNITFKLPVTCDECGFEEEVTVPLGASFLWPEAGR
jgi:hypothetical protein